MNAHLIHVGAASMLLACACFSESEPPSNAAPRASEDLGVPIPLQEVPELVLDAAREALPGLIPVDVEQELEGERTVYCVRGMLDGREYEVECTATGEVLEIELQIKGYEIPTRD